MPARSTGTTSGTGPASLTPAGRPQRGGHRHRPHAHLAHGLVGEQGYQFVGQAAERGGLGALLPQHGELVRDQRMINDQSLHDQ